MIFGTEPLTPKSKSEIAFPRFFDLYFRYTEDTEPAFQHHLGVSLALASQCVGGLSFVKYGHKSVHMNLYCGLIAPSGTRKTEAIRIGMELYSEAVRQSSGLLKPPLPDISSNVAIMQTCDFHKQERVVKATVGGSEEAFTSVFIVASEFSSFIRNRDRDMITFLTNIFDGAVAQGEFQYKTQMGGYFRILNPYAVLLMASTPEWLSQALPKHSFQGGFLNRFLFFYSDKHKIKAFPLESDLSQDLPRQIIDSMLRMAQRNVRVSWTDDAKRLFTDWYENQSSALIDQSDPVMSSWLARIGIFLIKVAGLSAIADNRAMISPADLDFAWFVLGYALSGAKRTLRFASGNTNVWLETKIVEMALEKPQKVSVICVKLSGTASAKEIRETILSLAAMGILRYDPKTDVVVAQQPQAEMFLV